MSALKNTATSHAQPAQLETSISKMDPALPAVQLILSGIVNQSTTTVTSTVLFHNSYLEESALPHVPHPRLLPQSVLFTNTVVEPVEVSFIQMDLVLQHARLLSILPFREVLRSHIAIFRVQLDNIYTIMELASIHVQLL